MNTVVTRSSFLSFKIVSDACSLLQRKKIAQPGLIFLSTKGRKYSSSSINRTKDVDVKEITIPVPWGHIAGRHWNGSDPSRHPVLCLHGWKDNAATYDTLMPQLVPELPEYQFVAIDLPGHGLSSHFPPGMIYSSFDMWILIQRICKHFKWDKKISLMGHSMGAQLSFSYSGTHPELVDQLVAIDSLSPIVISRETTIDMLPKLTSDALKFEEKLKSGQRPTYTYDQILEKLLKTHTGGMDIPSCKTLMTRGISENPAGSGKYEFSHDIRVHYMPISGISQRQVEFISRNIQCDVLYIRASNGVNYISKYIKDRLPDWLQKDDDGNRKNNLVRFVTVDGNHHLHLIDPQSVVPYIVRFMSKKEGIHDDLILDA